jgi:hypothetical protein
MEQLMMDQILENLKAAMMAELKAMTELNRVKMEAKMVAWLREMKAITGVCEETTEACPVKTEAKRANPRRNRGCGGAPGSPRGSDGRGGNRSHRGLI